DEPPAPVGPGARGVPDVRRQAGRVPEGRARDVRHARGDVGPVSPPARSHRLRGGRLPVGSRPGPPSRYSSATPGPQTWWPRMASSTSAPAPRPATRRAAAAPPRGPSSRTAPSNATPSTSVLIRRPLAPPPIGPWVVARPVGPAAGGLLAPAPGRPPAHAGRPVRGGSGGAGSGRPDG